MVGRFLDGASDQDTVLDREAAAEVGSPQLARLGAWLVDECRALLDPADAEPDPPPASDPPASQAGSDRAGMLGWRSRRVMAIVAGDSDAMPHPRSPSPVRALRRSVSIHASSSRFLWAGGARGEMGGFGWRRRLDSEQRFDYFRRKVRAGQAEQVRR